MTRPVCAVLLAALALLATLVTAPGTGATTDDPGALPVIEIHGFDSADCPGTDESYVWSPLHRVLHDAGWTGPLLPVSFYACDYDGADISGYGPDTPAVASPDVTPDHARAAYRQDTPIATIAHDLAWYVYRNFTLHDQPVDVVSSSMGGLIIRTALHRVAAGDPTFPPTLQVSQSITFSTPHRGLGTVAGNATEPDCHGMRQCVEWGADSPLMTELTRDGSDPQGAGGTLWTVIGSSAGCDFLPTSSALGLPHALQIDFTTPCYTHVGYFFDVETTRDATAVSRYGDGGSATTTTDSPHSLALAVGLLQNPRQAPASPPTSTSPTPVVVAEPIVSPLPRHVSSRTVLVRFRARVDSDATTFDLRYRVLRRSVRPRGWSRPANLRGVPAGSRVLQPPSDATRLCVSARARVGGHASGWTRATCTVLVRRR